MVALVTKWQCDLHKSPIALFFPLRCFDPIPGHGLLLRGFTITLRHTTLGTAPLEECPARRSDLYLTTHNTYKKQTSLPPAGIRTYNPRKPAALTPRPVAIRIVTSRR